MKTTLKGKDRVKPMGFKRFKDSFKYSWAGIKYAYTNEQSMVIHIGITVVAIILGFFLKNSIIEWMFCLVMIGFVMAAELLNTAIEAVVDMAMPDIHPLAKIAKDTASAAVGILALVAAIIGGIIFLPKLIAVIMAWI